MNVAGFDRTEKRAFQRYPMRWRAAVTVAAVASIFTLVVCIALISNYLMLTLNNPLDNPELVKLREQLAASSGDNAALIEQIRAMDLLARKAFFTSQTQIRTGAFMLLGGAVVMLVSFKLAALWNPRLPKPSSARQDKPSLWDTAGQTRHLVGAAAVLIVTFSLLAAYLTPNEMDRAVKVKSSGGAEKPAMVIPTWNDIQVNWPSFRGPGGYGVAHFTNAPISWDAATGQNILWTAEVPMPGYNSPVVWGNRLFVSGATAETREVFCYDTETGNLLWRRTVPNLPGSTGKVPKVMEDDTGYAASSMVVHGDRACAIFANGDLVCYDFSGRRLWGLNLGVPDNHYGHSSSLIAYDHLLFVQYDQNTNSKLMAFDIRDGSKAWTVPRKSISWSSPALIPLHGGIELVLTCEKTVDAYDPMTGTALWSVECLDGEVGPSAAYGAGLVFAVSDMSTASAIKVTKTAAGFEPKIMWQWDDSLPDIASPAANDTNVYLAMSFAEIACLDIATGKQAWIEDFDDGFSASPIIVGDRVYALDEAGTTTIFKTGPKYEVVGTGKLGEPAAATPAFLDGRIYIRTTGHIYCVENQNKN
ncbi:MAG: PQQ-binding-like beta-propeller repeat protein [Candidatus Hydrogenedentes bacterium]|nr:PQQ-binding-like beta-propeller repeat protein [Candidatus Hydrogenedentota bacterium]